MTRFAYLRSSRDCQFRKDDVRISHPDSEHEDIDVAIRVLHFSWSTVYRALEQGLKRRIGSGTRGARRTRGGRKLTRRKRTRAEEKENTLVKYKGYSRLCNRVISRNPLFFEPAARMCALVLLAPPRPVSIPAFYRFIPQRESQFHLLLAITRLLSRCIRFNETSSHSRSRNQRGKRCNAEAR